MSGGGYVPQDPAGYDEPDPTTGNRSFADYQQQIKVKENRSNAFRDGTGR